MVLLRYTTCMVVPTYTNVWLYLPHIPMSNVPTYANLVYQNTAMSSCTYTHEMFGNYTHTHTHTHTHTQISGCTYLHQCLVVPTTE